VQQASQHFSMMNAAILAALLIRERCSLFQPLMRARFIIKLHVFPHHAMQVALVDNQQVIQALLA
jgi:hypothetical protein